MKMDPDSGVSLPQVLSAGVAVWPDRGPRVLHMTGDDCQDFLQRMTTNDMRRLAQDTAVTTSFLTGTGRLIAVFTIIPEEDGYWLLAPPGQAEDLRTALQGNIFFMDQVGIRDTSKDWQCLQLHGAEADRVLSLLGFEGLETREGSIARAAGLLCVYQDALELPGYQLIVPVDRVSQLLHALQQAHAVLMQDWQSYHRMRIMAGRGGFDTEFTDDYNPLEVGLAWLCAENKGCYPGQEIIARQITYDKVTRQLVQLESNTPLLPGTVVTAGTAKAGKITSQAPDPDSGGYVGLAVVGRRYLEQGSALQIEGHSISWVQATSSTG